MGAISPADISPWAVFDCFCEYGFRFEAICDWYLRLQFMTRGNQSTETKIVLTLEYITSRSETKDDSTNNRRDSRRSRILKFTRSLYIRLEHQIAANNMPIMLLLSSSKKENTLKIEELLQHLISFLFIKVLFMSN